MATCRSARSKRESVILPSRSSAFGIGSGIRFTSAIPPYLRRAKSIEELLPWLYLNGISTGDFREALAALLGPEAPGLSAATICRLKAVWQGELDAWQRRDPTGKRHVYFWVDGATFHARWSGQGDRTGDQQRSLDRGRKPALIPR